jgi:ubiquitin-protein ligase
MTTPQELRRIRLQNDYKEMQNISGNIVQWKPVKGESPYTEAYELTIQIRTIISSQPKYRDKHVIYLEIPANYPTVPPQINMRTNPPPFHPNWYVNGNWCYGTWDVSEGLGHHVIRMIRTLQFDLEITNPNSRANYNAGDWFETNRNRGLFPCDRSVLPDPTKSRFQIKTPPSKKFNIQG